VALVRPGETILNLSPGTRTYITTTSQTEQPTESVSLSPHPAPQPPPKKSSFPSVRYPSVLRLVNCQSCVTGNVKFVNFVSWKKPWEAKSLSPGGKCEEFLHCIPYYRKLTRLKLTRIEGKNYFPIKEINAKKGVKFQNEEN